MTIELQVTATGGIQMLHSDLVDLSDFGQVHVTRASHVEFDDATQAWFVQSARTMKVLKADFQTRAEALAWEKEYYSPSGKGWSELTKEVS